MLSGKVFKYTRKQLSSGFHKNVSARKLSEEEADKLSAEVREAEKVARDGFGSLRPITPEQIYTPVAEATIKGYQEVYDLFSKPIDRDLLPPIYYQLDSDAKREALVAHMKAYQDAKAPLGSKYGFAVGAADFRIDAAMERANLPMKQTPIRVCVTGASGQLGYALVFRIASGGLFGPDQPVILHLVELEQALPTLEGVVMELKDCAFPTLAGVVATSQLDRGFDGVDYALLVGAAPRTKGMERGDLLTKNGEIFAVQGKALNTHAKGSATRVIVVGNPANTNALIACHNAPNIPRENFSALTRLDHNRALAQLAQKGKCNINDIRRFVIWGNHSATMVPDITQAYVKNKLATDVFTDANWLKKEFLPSVQKRGAAIIEKRGVSSAASAANAVVEACASWHFGTAAQWTSAAHYSNGEYGVTPGLFYSYPVVYNESREWDIVRNLPIDQATAELMEATHKELLEERNAVSHLLKE